MCSRQCLGLSSPKHSSMHRGSEQGIRKVSTLTHVFPSPAPPRLQLVPGHEGLRCTGVVEFYNGSRGGTILYKAKARPVDLGNLICKSLQCGSFLTHLSRIETAGTPAPEELRDPRPLPIRWEAQNGSCTSLQQCFQKTTAQEGSQALAVVCSGKLETDPIIRLSVASE